MNQILKTLPIESKEAFFEGNKEKVLSQASGQVKLLADPEGYARGAIECLEGQLLGSKSEKKIARIKAKISEWKKVLEAASEVKE